MTSSGVIEDRPASITQHYIRNDFLYDVVALLPVDYLAMMVTKKMNIIFRVNRFLWLRYWFRFLDILKAKSPQQGLHGYGDYLHSIYDTIVCVIYVYTMYSM